MAEEQKVFVMTPYQQGVLVHTLNEQRNGCLRAGKPTEDIDELLLKAIDAPPLKKRRWPDREER
jgi:hypothetical protein